MGTARSEHSSTAHAHARAGPRPQAPPALQQARSQLGPAQRERRAQPPFVIPLRRQAVTAQGMPLSGLPHTKCRTRAHTQAHQRSHSTCTIGVAQATAAPRQARAVHLANRAPPGSPRPQEFEAVSYAHHLSGPGRTKYESVTSSLGRQAHDRTHTAPATHHRAVSADSPQMSTARSTGHHQRRAVSKHRSTFLIEGHGRLCP